MDVKNLTKWNLFSIKVQRLLSASVCEKVSLCVLQAWFFSIFGVRFSAGTLTITLWQQRHHPVRHEHITHISPETIPRQH